MATTRSLGEPGNAVSKKTRNSRCVKKPESFTTLAKLEEILGYRVIEVAQIYNFVIDDYAISLAVVKLPVWLCFLTFRFILLAGNESAAL